MFVLDRGLAQLASAPALGAGGREFKSHIPDQVETLLHQGSRAGDQEILGANPSTPTIQNESIFF